MADVIEPLPDGAAPIDARLARLSPTKRALLSIVPRREEPSSWTIPPRPRRDRAPLSFAQYRLWLLEHIERPGAAYNVASAAEIRGPLDVDALAASVAALSERHETLRTSFELEDGEPVQRIHDELRVRLTTHDLRDRGRREREEMYRRILRDEPLRTFDLTQAPLVRASLIRLTDERAVFLLVRHHIVNDAASNDVYARELAAFYAAFRSGTPQPPRLPVHYADYAAWQRANDADRESDLRYWLSELEGAPSGIDLPADHVRPQAQTFDGALETRVLPESLALRLSALARTSRVSPFMIALTAFELLLARYTGREDIVLGTPVANRDLTELEPLIGFFVNTLVLRARVAPDDSFAATLARNRESVLNAFEHRQLPFERLVEALRPEREPGRPPLANVFFVMHAGDERRLELDGLEVEPIPLARTTAKVDLTLHVHQRPESLQCTLEYNVALFDAERMQRMLGHYERLLDAALADPNAAVRDLPLLTAQECERLLGREPAAATAPGDAAVHIAIERAAHRDPDAPALRFGRVTVTYRELNARANRLAHRLRARGAAPGTLVGLCVERSDAMVVGLLGILKSGAAYVPLDPEYPADRLERMTDGLRLAVVDATGKRALPHVSAFVALDDPTLADEPDDDPVNRATPDDLAYVMYTSGSTGTPKGVMMPQRALLNLLAWQARRCAHLSQPKTLAFASLSFDVSFQEIVSTLATGGTLVVAREDQRRDLRSLVELVEAEGVERIFLPFVVLQQFTATAVAIDAAMPRLRLVVTAGEQLRMTDAIRTFFTARPSCALDNQYGPTEAHVVCAHLLEGDPAAWPALPPIGRPIDNVRLYVLDRCERLAPIGVDGELCIAGIALAEGYLERADLTAERFVERAVEGRRERLYRTGDLARMQPDGTIAYLGRIDRQVKLRGFRVELGDVEAALRAVPGVRDAAAVVLAAPNGEPRLNAYVVAEEGACDPEQVRDALTKRLPRYMLPAAVVAVAELPVTSNGKLDVRALPPASPPAATRAAGVELSPLHVQLLDLWQQVLGVDGIGLDDDFFACGGSSLTAVVLINRMWETFGRRIPAASFFAGATVAAIADQLRADANRDAVHRLITVRESGERAPFVYLHGDLNGGGYYCRSLFRHLASDRPLYVFTPHGVDDDTIPPTIEAIACENLDVLRAARPHGPYALGGYCSAGLVAYEMARRLTAAGERVEQLVLIDANVRSSWLWPLAEMGARAAAVLRFPEATLLRTLGTVAARARVARDLLEAGRDGWAQFATRAFSRLLDTAARTRRGGELTDRWLERSARYVPRRYEGALTVFWPAARDASLRTSLAADWRRVAPRATAITAAGDHLSCITRDAPDLGPRIAAALGDDR